MSMSYENSDSSVMLIRQMINGYRVTQMIYVAAKLRIADILADQPKYIGEIAASVGAHPLSLYRLLRALASLGVFVQGADGRFELNTPAKLLRSDIPGSLHPFALTYGEQWWWEPWGQLLYGVCSGETAFNHIYNQSLFEYFDENPGAASIFNANMASMSMGEGKAIVAAYDFSKTDILIDIGGGHGALAAAILTTCPQVHAILFDLPFVIEGARGHLVELGIANRCELLAGDFFKSIPSGGDTYTLKDIIHDWDDDHAITILRNCRRVMADTAKLLLIERVIPLGNEFADAKLIDITMLVLTGGMERTEAEYQVLLNAAGFKLKNTVTTSTGTCVLEAMPV
jgi:hypothetical protein